MENNFTNNGIHTLYKRSQANYKNLIRGGWSPSYMRGHTFEPSLLATDYNRFFSSKVQ